jgi:hypothetical protein
MIYLPLGGRFNEHDLEAHIRASGRDYIIQGQQSVARARHTKPQSLDYWLRQFGHSADTKQAENSVMDALAATKLFVIAYKLACPDSGKDCKGLRLVQPPQGYHYRNFH